MQIGPHTMLDEGIERALDLVRETAAVDTVFPYSHAYGGNLRKPAELLARDHGIVPRSRREGGEGREGRVTLEEAAIPRPRATSPAVGGGEVG